MEIDQILQNTFSADSTARQNAEQQLAHAADVNFSEYLTTLARELANEDSKADVRQAAGIALKNSFTARESARLSEIQQKWLQAVEPSTKSTVKQLALQALGSKNRVAGQAAAQFVSSIAAIDIPQQQWPELMPVLVENVGQGDDHLKQASLQTIGFICESDDYELRSSLIQHSNAILTAVVQGARKEEKNMEVRLAAINSLSDSLEFVRTNFENEGERNYIMQVICEATQSGDSRIEASAYGCLNRIMGLYYDKMKFYMEKALFGLTIMGMKSEEEDVAKLAIEFWCTVCEEELAIEDDNHMAQQEGSDLRVFYNFSRIAAREVVPVLLELLAHQDEDAADEEYNVSRAAYQCLQLYAQTIGSDIVSTVIVFVEANLRDADWHKRDAAVSAFGAIMEGPTEDVLQPLIKQGLPVLIGMMDDQVLQVKDSAAFALGRICENAAESISAEEHLQPLITVLFNGLTSNPKMAGSCCWALMNLAERFAGPSGAATNEISPHFRNSIATLLTVTEGANTDNQVRMAAYEVLNTFFTNAANDSLPTVAEMSSHILGRLEGTINMQKQIVSVEDRVTLEEMQTSLTSVLLGIIQRLEGEVKPAADRIMNVLLQVLSSSGAKSTVPDTVFAAIGALANALEEDFGKYMDSFTPFLYNALGNREEPGLCAMAIGLVSDITRALGEMSQPYCDDFMNYLLSNLNDKSTSNQFRPAILQTFGDIAQAIGPHFETYLSVVGQVLQAAANVTSNENSTMELVEYIISLREGIMDAWSGTILAMKHKPALLGPYVEPVFSMLHLIASDPNRSEALLRSTMGVIGDLADTFSTGEYSQLFRPDWLSALIKEAKTNREFSPRTIETARWAREQVKRQIALA